MCYNEKKTTKNILILVVLKVFLVCCISLLVSPAYGLEDVSFSYLGLSDGLSQSSVMAMEQDSLGRIWIGTREGLDVYNGNEIKTFRPIKGDTNSILGFNVRDLRLDNGFLWINTNEGISKLNLKKQSFEQFPFIGSRTIQPFEGNLLFGTNRGLFELDVNTKNTKLKTDIFNEIAVINYLFKDNAGILWICSDKGLYKYNPNLKITALILKGIITTIFTDSQKRIWVGTDGDGVYLLNRQNELIKHFLHNNNPNSLTNNIVRDIDENTNGNIWIGTFYGLSIVDANDFSIRNFKQSNKKPKSLSHNSIYTILKDRQGTMWIGTYFGAISYFNPEYNIFKRYIANSLNAEGTSYRVIGKIIEDNRNNLWIATEGGGLDYYNRTTNTFKHYKHIEGHKGLSHNNVKALYLHNDSTLFIGTHFGGFNILDINSGQFTSYLPDSTKKNAIPSSVVSCIIPFNGNYLLGTQMGVIFFDQKKNTFSHFFKNKEKEAIAGRNIFCLFEDSFGKLWIGTEKQGLTSYDLETKKLVKYYYQGNELNSIGSNKIYTIYEDHKFRLWVGTLGGGLNQYIRDKDKFKSYTHAKDNLPSDFIRGIQESRLGYLWITTSKGLVRFDVDNDKFYNYDLKNGFPLEELNEGALYLTNDGEVFVGGINGMISFKEEDVLKRSNDFNLLFSSLYINNVEQIPNTPNSILKEDFAFTKSITLNPEQNVFTINFSACNYIASNQSILQYKLENFNENWINSGSKKSVTYTNLDAGTYTLKLRSLNSIDQNVIDEAKIKIKINPPIYLTWYAYLLYLLIIIGVIIWLNQIYLSKVRLMDKLKIEQREKEQIKDLNQSKLKFFTNISHEFRTPLTLITGTLESLLEDSKTKTRTYRKLLTVNHNAVRLNNLISELLDFRKLEQGFFKLKVCENNLSVFLEEIYHSFVEYAQHNNIDYEFKRPAQSLILWYDIRQMEKVFYNIFANAFKFVSEENGKVTMEVIEQTTFVDIIITDNGPGLPPDDIEKIFDRFYQINNISGKTRGQSSGIGLALCKGIIKEHHGKILVKSKEHFGTAFTIRVLKGNKHFSENELVINSELENKSKESAVTYLDAQSLEFDEKVLVAADDAPTILIVEDNPDVRKLLKDIFKSSYKLIEAEDGIQGMQLAMDKQPNLIISDVMMPNLSGTELCAKIKRNINTSHIPIILLTARTAMEYKIEGIETGADDYITKPFSTKLLKARVKNLLLNRALIQQRFKQNPLAEVQQITSNSLDQELLKKAREIINEHIDDTEFSVNNFAQEVGLGRTRLYEKIKGVTGQTPNEFILSIRLKKAAELLIKNTELNVSEIAYSTGFSTPRYFSRCFKEYFGISPSKYGDNIAE